MADENPVVSGEAGAWAVEVRPATRRDVEIAARYGDSEAVTRTVQKDRWVKLSAIRDISASLADDDNATLKQALKRARTAAMCRSDWEQFMLPQISVTSIENLKSLTDPQECPGIQEDAVPTNEEVWNRRNAAIFDALRSAGYIVLILPTAAGKSYVIATTKWTEHEDKTGGRAVVHLSPTKDARDDAVKKAEAAEDDIEYYVLEGRHDLCGYAQGKYDDEIDLPDMDVSEWLDHACSVKQMSFAEARNRLEQITGEEHDCSEEHDECPASNQFDEIRNSLNGDPEYDVIFATHGFAHVPRVRDDNNLVVDEQPSTFALIGPGAQDGGRHEDGPMHQGHVEAAVNAFLVNADSSIRTVEELLTIAEREARGLDYKEVREEFQALYDDVFHHHPSKDWYWEHRDAAKPSRAYTEALWEAARKEPDANGRRAATVAYRPPRLKNTPRGNEDETLENKKWLMVVLDEDNTICTLRITPNFDDARSVVGLDAHPCEELWRANVGENLDFVAPLSTEERSLFRRFRRRLLVIQCGSGNYSYTNDDSVNTRKLRAFLDTLRYNYGEQFRSAIPPDGSLELTEDLMRDVGIEKPKTMNQEAAKSRNDFKGERIGATIGCTDPGDDYVLDILAETCHDAWPEYNENEDCKSCAGDGCKSCQWTGHYRLNGRGFQGPDAEAAASILGSVRENNVAQTNGRWAREPTNPNDWAAVFNWGQAVPETLKDFEGVTVSGYSETQRAIIKHLRDTETATAREIVEWMKETEDIEPCKKEYVRQRLQTHEDHGEVSIEEGDGYNGAHLYQWEGAPATYGYVDFTMYDAATSRSDEEPGVEPLEIPGD